MDPTAQHHARSIDVTGLPDEAIRAVEALVSHFRSQTQGGPAAFSSYEEWSKAFGEWLASHKPLETSADYSRESIYLDRA